jgi:hypothetical protein
MPPVKTAKIVLGTLVTLAALYGFGSFFRAALGGGGRSTEPAAVLLAAPPGFVVVDRGELSRAQAARELADLLSGRPGEGRLGLHFTSAGARLYWLVDRREAPSAVLTELAAGSQGTRVDSNWSGSRDELDRRLAWASQHGDLNAPGLPRGESRNLYH